MIDERVRRLIMCGDAGFGKFPRLGV